MVIVIIVIQIVAILWSVFYIDIFFMMVHSLFFTYDIFSNINIYYKINICNVYLIMFFIQFIYIFLNFTIGYEINDKFKC